MKIEFTSPVSDRMMYTFSNNSMAVHLLHNNAKGPDPFLIRQRLDELLKGIQREGNLNFTTYDLSESSTSFHDVVTSAMTVPFLGGRRVVVAMSVRSIEKSFKRKPARTKEAGVAEEKVEDAEETEDEEDEEDIDVDAQEETESESAQSILRAIEQLNSLPTEALLILVEENGHLDGRTAFMRELKKVGCEIFEAKAMWFDAATGDIKNAVVFIQSQASRLGIRLSANVAERFTLLAGSDRGNILKELEKLAMYCGKGARPTTEDVDNVVTPSYEAGIFHLVDVIGMGRTGEAMHVLSDLIDRGAPYPYILTMVARQIRLIARVRDALSNGASWNSKELGKQLGESPFVMGKILDQTRRFRAFYYPEILEYLMDADVHLKRGTMPPRLAMETLIARLVNPHQ